MWEAAPIFVSVCVGVYLVSIQRLIDCAYNCLGSRPGGMSMLIIAMQIAYEFQIVSAECFECISNSLCLRLNWAQLIDAINRCQSSLCSPVLSPCHSLLLGSNLSMNWHHLSDIYRLFETSIYLYLRPDQAKSVSQLGPLVIRPPHRLSVTFIVLNYFQTGFAI